jgi:6-phosphogluconate dehydrogenase
MTLASARYPNFEQMAAPAEGIAILLNAGICSATRNVGAESAPLADAEFCAYDFGIPEMLEVWRWGSVVSSRLVDLTAEAACRDAELTEFAGYVAI